jgi:hypothetical protein
MSEYNNIRLAHGPYLAYSLHNESTSIETIYETLELVYDSVKGTTTTCAMSKLNIYI